MSQATKFTPGPWHAWDRGIGFEVHTGKGPCDGDCGGCINDGFRETFTEANARLIAAAPDLYKVLHDGLAMHKGECASPGDCPFLRDAEAALRRARGET